MKNQVTDIRVRNFKSIKDVKVNGLKRINLFIGKPNVGKSNFLEAIGLFSTPYHQGDESKLFNDYIRYDKINELFFEKDIANDISIETNLGNAYVRNLFANHFDFLILDKKIELVPEAELNNDQLGMLWHRMRELFAEKKKDDPIPMYYRAVANTGNNQPSEMSLPDVPRYEGVIKKYTFNNNVSETNPYSFFLLPPFGYNLAIMLRKNKSVMKLFSSIMEREYNLQLAIDSIENKILVLKKEGPLIVTYPYLLLADTLRRIIFYYAAIETNKNAVLALEEPEVHSFPAYIKMLADKIVSNKDNQYFIATHSPYLYENIVSKASKDDFTVHLVDYKNFQTVTSRLSAKQISESLDMDVFFNLDKFSK